ncbi:YfbU family protein [Sinorhizobium medicae]|uniref:YfbU family protein n=1 Tax=Sinorhizobium medicae TaxID=110321 RepID=UPI002AF6C98F|nr:YfbU family protein [Sinorhizobium medicae]WQO61918.1 YfbU family protein [Sinorhizobium medicae]WQP40857.1 YfbU family protein [Sinorhizobium medicae]
MPAAGQQRIRRQQRCWRTQLEAVHRSAREIVERGYEYLYATLNPSVEAKVVPAAVGREVYDILDMFRASKGR